MTTPLDTLDRVLSGYREHPMRDGDVALITDLKVISEVERLADEWDPVLRRHTAYALRELGAREVLLAIARPDAVLRPQDHALWADLREELLGDDIHLRPPLAVPALVTSARG
jgi:hypothetical protein